MLTRSPRRACAMLATLLALCPQFALAQSGLDPMDALDAQFDQKKVAEILGLRKRIANLGHAEAAQQRAGKRDPVTLAALRDKTEEVRNALADVAVDYVAQMEMAEALVRLDLGQALADRYRKDLSDTLWRLDRRAQTGDARASATLGGLYRLGIVVERDEAKACAYYGRAAQQGHVAALFQASACADPKSAAAGELLARAANGGHPLAQEMKGRLCLREKRDAECALAWLARAAAQGRAGAMSLLGWAYSTGDLIARDDKRAFAYFMDAARLGEPAAQNNVGQMYETGRGEPANPGAAFAWYQRAAEAGLGSAQVNLARAYIEGRGTAADRVAATFWLEQARKQGVGEAVKLLDWLAAH